MKCVRCGTELNENDKVCLGCGFEVGQKYEKTEKSETLESLMEMPTLEDNNDIDDAEELDVNESLNVTESIDGDSVSISSLNVATGDSLVIHKSKKKYWFILIVLIFIFGGFGIYKMVSYMLDDGDDVFVPPAETKPNIINHPTSLYSFGGNFIYKINNLWIENTKTTNQANVLESRTFITDGASLDVVLYSFNDNQLDSYTNYLKISTNYEKINVNDVEYCVFAFENNKNYVKIVGNYLYAFEFTFSEDIDNLINDIINNIIFYN